MRIAIIGAGMAGASCGIRLAASGHAVEVFDKGRGPGGRMATRRIEVDGKTYRLDHGAQYFTARDPAFAAQVEAWEADGIVARWPAAKDGARVGTPGMNAPVRAMAEALGVRFAARVEGLERAGEGWLLNGEGAPTDAFDAVVVAVPAEQAGPLLAPHAPGMASQAEAVESAPCWAAMAVFDTPLAIENDTLADRGPIAWAARNSAKPGRGEGECWVLHATPDWSRANLERERDDVAADLLAQFGAVAGDLPPVLALTAHRWRYAMVEKGGPGALWDDALRLGACGDWLSGPRVENAFLSGVDLAARIGAA